MSTEKDEVQDAADLVASKILDCVIAGFKKEHKRDPSSVEIEEMMNELTEERVADLMGQGVEGSVAENPEKDQDAPEKDGEEDAEGEEEEEEGEVDDDDDTVVVHPVSKKNKTVDEEEEQTSPKKLKTGETSRSVDVENKAPNAVL